MTFFDISFNDITVMMRDTNTYVQSLSSLYCRTRISVQSYKIIEYQDINGASRKDFRFAPFLYFSGGA